MIRQTARYTLTIVRDSYLLLLIPLLWAGTILCAHAGLDAAIHGIARLQSERFSTLWSALPLHVGSVAPFLVPLLMCARNRPRALLIMQSVGFTVVIVTVLKALTSRVDPENLSIADVYLRSNSFSSGLLANGLASVVEGWPSGHAATNTAMVIAAVLGLGQRVKTAGGFWAAWVVLATVLGDRGGVHWFSDSISGVAIGGAIAFAHVSMRQQPDKPLQQGGQVLNLV